MLTLLIPGPKQPGNDFDIFLQPLIDDLKLLWDGVEVYDVVNKSNFNLRAMLIWTINDFPAYGNLARRFLPPSHPYRRKKSWFDGKVEDRKVPRITNENAIDTQLKDFQNLLGKVDKKKRKRQKELKRMWKKRSIFFDLPYWKELVLRHNLDIMHVEKNRYFPPSFFDIMTHLVIHLGHEVRLCGPVQFRWMYPFKRYMKTLKGFVRNQSRPEGCIAERYLAEECILFYKNCVQGSTRLDDKQRRNEEFNNDIILEGRPISTGKEITLSDEVLNLAHQYVLFNTKAVEPYIEMHRNELILSNKRLANDDTQVMKVHSEQFPIWLKEKKRLRYIEMACKWTTQDRNVIFRLSDGDGSPKIDVVIYYGVLTEIILLDYYVYRLPMFKCDWAKIHNGVKVDDGFTLVNLHQNQSQFSSEPYILASQAKQVFYARENDNSPWYIVLKAPPRGFHELDKYDENVDTSFVGDGSSLALDDIDDEFECATIHGTIVKASYYDYLQLTVIL
ncbi:uncharacterized protein E5676_scaffold629G002060 [Cucumis melo var. makuwa]|uniref:DUF4218 domain-containing protein n=1 Tax=Cucumis melo var. makuwa TaxID=1194695 RepID=A0A5D3DYV1_CUCMM|nr:uncharacterized protein E5676_scaffold629G002060 [Cucumis melo var. makuwa]